MRQSCDLTKLLPGIVKAKLLTAQKDCSTPLGCTKGVWVLSTVSLHLRVKSIEC